MVHDGDGAVGATDLLKDGEVLLVDMSGPVQYLADQVQRLMEDTSSILSVALRASAKARSWSEAANAARLMNMTKSALAAYQ